MRDIKYTPGKWRLTERKIGVESLVPHDNAGFVCHSRVPVATTDSKNPNREADARLIAAAPDLLEIVEALVAHAQSGASFHYPSGSLDMMQKAIQKVRGGA